MTALATPRRAPHQARRRPPVRPRADPGTPRPVRALERGGAVPLRLPEPSGPDRFSETSPVPCSAACGAGFPTADKLVAVARWRGRSIVVANWSRATDEREGPDPAPRARPAVLTRAAAHPVGAREAICLHRGIPARLLASALHERFQDTGRAQLVEGPRYVAARVGTGNSSTPASPSYDRAGSEKGLRQAAAGDNVDTAHIA